MIKYKQAEVTRTEEVFDAMICDKCGKEYRDDMEVQEFHRIDFTGGFNSVFGDGNRIQCDLCQDCLYVMISEYIKVADTIW